MIPAGILNTATAMGFDEVERVTLTSGEVVYVLIGEGKIGLPMYLHYVDGIVMLSTSEESMALLSEPDFLGDDD